MALSNCEMALAERFASPVPVYGILVVLIRILLAEELQAPPAGSDPLTNLKWERFAQYMAKGQSSVDGYEMAGTNPCGERRQAGG